ncbi:hypothetical protein CBW65_03930 [Tumebacillus avium]|uniref:HTH cro/C1-type domain-containing protein n=1 Tax=Tumebacillus avium TaxID=1903704 RepID=A0A1Y0IKF0_9BACL|nr:tetratricopeptide repeat protein [Tumebacillus avium]ARU60306.1 hypothetical protein CBW65_03930 [Tumebacillus avium]
MQEFSLGQRIRQLRVTKGMTQIELCKGLCTPSMISQIESDRARPSYKVLSVIAERLEVTLEKLLSALNWNLEIDSLYKMAKMMVASGAYTLAIPLLLQVVDQPAYKIPRGDIQFLLGVCYLNTQEYSKAEQILDEVNQTAAEKQNYDLQAKTLHQLGLMYQRMKKHHLAIFQLEKAQDQARKGGIQDPVLLSKIWVDLGWAHLRLGRVNQAVACFEQGTALMEGMQNCRDLADLYLQMGKICRSAGDQEKAGEYADRATALYNGLDHVSLKLKIECEAALMRTGKGGTDPVLVLDTLHSSIAQFLELREKGMAGEAYFELAKFQLEHCEIDNAVQSLEQARLLLPETNLFRGRVLFLQGQVAVQSGDVNEAIHYYEKAAGFLKDSNAFREWEAVISELAELHMAAGNEKHAYHLMHEGYQAAHQTMRARGIYL